MAGGFFGWLRDNLVVAGVAFSASILVPFCLTLALGGSVARQESSEEPTTGEDTFPDSLVVHEQGVSYRIPHSQDLDPGSNSGDFALVTWFKLRKPLTVGDRMIFLGKYDTSSKVRPGFSVGISRDGDGARPIVYWQSSNGRGRWYSFSVTDVPSRVWNYMVISFREGRYLGVHFGSDGSKLKPVMLGGYDLERSVLPESSASLVIGAFGGARFRGRIGPFGVIRHPKLTGLIDEFISEIGARPGEIPESVGKDAIKLWVRGGVDRSPSARRIEVLPKAGAQVSDE
jgi:hypothetical protein